MEQRDLERLLREFEGNIHRKWQINTWEGLGEGVGEINKQLIWPEQLGGGKALAGQGLAGEGGLEGGGKPMRSGAWDTLGLLCGERPMEMPDGQIDLHIWSLRETWARETLEGWPEMKGWSMVTLGVTLQVSVQALSAMLGHQ